MLMRNMSNKEDDKNDAIDIDEIQLPNDDENCGQRENIDLVMVQQVVECENTRYVNLEVGDKSNDLKVEFEVENISLVASSHGTQVYISNENQEATFAPLLNLDRVINCVVSDWTP
ncbi:hypothetical protein AAG906_011574 [Vitis piasezkii]